MPGETKSKRLLPLAVQAIVMAPPIETAKLYPPVPENKEWEKHPDRVNIEEEMCYFHIRPDKGLGRKNDPPLAARIPIPPQLHELRLLFPVMFNMNGNKTYNGLYMNIMKDF
jgi:hypothetical protein